MLYALFIESFFFGGYFYFLFASLNDEHEDATRHNNVKKRDFFENVKGPIVSDGLYLLLINSAP